MLRLLKAEFIDNKYVLIIPYCLFLLPIIINITQGWPTPEFDLRGIKMMMAGGIILIFLLRSTRFLKDKKDRLFILLPLSIRQIAITRLLFIVTVWLSFVLIYWLSSLTIKSYHPNLVLWETLSLTGFILIVGAYPFLFRDISICFPGRYQRLALGIFNLIILIISYAVFYMLFATNVPYFEFLRRLEPQQTEYAKISASPLGTIIFLLLGLGVSSASVYLFKYRKSYLN